jgi:A/G-specific adenine glycosylase
VNRLSASAAAAFRRKIYRWFSSHGRDLPWRFSDDPYRVLVSEIMLQQTQVDRVVPKYRAFIDTFPDFETLAAAAPRAVLAAWQGLGYNRRALMLQRCARETVERFGARLPDSPRLLITLPGIGPATAASIAAFAFNAPTVFIETNIRTVFIHEFFGDREGIPDAEILPLVRATLDKRNPARWYNALMDYGVMIKKTRGNPARRSAHHVKQSAFAGSDRQIRGAIIRELLKGAPLGARALATRCGAAPVRLEAIIERLRAEGVVVCRGARYTIE